MDPIVSHSLSSPQISQTIVPPTVAQVMSAMAVVLANTEIAMDATATPVVRKRRRVRVR